MWYISGTKTTLVLFAELVLQVCSDLLELELQSIDVDLLEDLHCGDDYLFLYTVFEDTAGQHFLRLFDL